MGFVTGLVIGLAAGAGGAVRPTRCRRVATFATSSGRSSRSCSSATSRHWYDLEDRFKELQTSLEERLSQAARTASDAADEAITEAESAVDEATETDLRDSSGAERWVASIGRSLLWGRSAPRPASAADGGPDADPHGRMTPRFRTVEPTVTAVAPSSLKAAA